MKKRFSLLLFSFIASLSCFSQSLKVPAEVYNDKTNAYVCNTTVTLDMYNQGNVLSIMVTPFPDTSNGLLYAFGREASLSSTWQNLCVGADNYWIISTLLKNSESDRHYLGFYSGKDGYNLYFYKKAYEEDEPNYYRGYHLSFEYENLMKVMHYIVSRINLFKELPSQSY